MYSRIIGEIKSDWQTWLTVKKPGETAINHLGYLAQEIATEIEATGSLISELSDAKIPNSLTEKAVTEIETTGSLANELKKRSQTKTVDTLSVELADVFTGELKSTADQNSHASWYLALTTIWLRLVAKIKKYSAVRANDLSPDNLPSVVCLQLYTT